MMEIVSSHLIESTGLVVCGISTRQGGTSCAPFGMNMSFSVGDAEENVRRNRDSFVQQLGVGVDRLAFPGQVHSNVVKRVDSPGRYPECDGLVTDTPDVYLCVSIADCVPILIVEEERKAVAVIHAGWRGTSSGIVSRGVEVLVEQFHCRSGKMIAYVGPSAGACCYSVGEDVAARFSPEFLSTADGRIFVDLKSANASQLVANGVPRERIEVSHHCTIHEARTFHSYRRDKNLSGRMIALIGLRPAQTH